MKIFMAVVAIASAALGAVVVGLAARGGGTAEQSSILAQSTRFVAQPGQEPELGNAPAMERLERAIKLKAGTKRPLAEFELADGRKLRLFTADTADSKSCLIDDDASFGVGASCLEDGLFAARRVAFSVGSQGGPDRFSELRVTGVVAPGVRSVELVTTDGRSREVKLTGNRAFLFESSAADLEEGIYPTELRLHGPSGRLVESVTFPPAG